MNKQNVKFVASENPYRVMEMLLHPAKSLCSVQSASKGLMDISVEGTITNH
jgi:hypothetical protein